MTEVFISYAREDKQRIRPLVNKLEQRGLNVFWDHNLVPGQSWHKILTEALSNAQCVIVAWSKDSVTSSWVLQEAEDGHRRDILVPVLLDSVLPPLGLRDILGIDLTGLSEGRGSPELDDLLKAVDSKIQSSSMPPISADATLPISVSALLTSASAPLPTSASAALPTSARAALPTSASAALPISLSALFEGLERQPAKPRQAQKVEIGEVPFPKENPDARPFYDGVTFGLREISVPVKFAHSFIQPPKIIVSLQKIDLGDVRANIHRISVSAQNVDETGFDLFFQTWAESQIYDAVACWTAIGA